ncbi:MAG TPA: hypothetical protein DCM67_11905 [Propionibacteriaceae bacterium]|nr:hypothetical protein [Propionibacteriaceae bacterium]
MDGSRFEADSWGTLGGMVVARSTALQDSVLAMWRPGMSEASICTVDLDADPDQITSPRWFATPGPNSKAVFVYEQRDPADGLNPAMVHVDARVVEPTSCAVSDAIVLVQNEESNSLNDWTVVNDLVDSTLVLKDGSTIWGVDVMTGTTTWRWHLNNCDSFVLQKGAIFCGDRFLDITTGHQVFPFKGSREISPSSHLTWLSPTVGLFQTSAYRDSEPPWTSDSLIFDTSTRKIWTKPSLKHAYDSWSTRVRGKKLVILTGRDDSDHDVFGYLDDVGEFHTIMESSLISRLNVAVKFVIHGKVYIETSDEKIVLDLGGKNLGRWDCAGEELPYTDDWALWSTGDGPLVASSDNAPECALSQTTNAGP